VGGLAESLRADAGRLGVDDAVSFSFRTGSGSRRTWLAADVFVLPSTTGGAEMFPLAILGRAAYAPVVTSDFPLRPIIREYDIGRLVSRATPTTSWRPLLTSVTRKHSPYVFSPS